MAAGSSQRLGEPKQLLHVDGELLINNMIGVIKRGGVEALYAVLGCEFEKINDAIKNLHVQVVSNLNWQEGIGSSIRSGIAALDEAFEAVMFFVVDQPYLSSTLIQDFTSQYLTQIPGILATRVNGQLCHPILFQKAFFKELLAIKGDKGGKVIFDRHEVRYFDWDDERLLVDIDTKKDYEEFKSSSGSSSS